MAAGGIGHLLHKEFLITVPGLSRQRLLPRPRRQLPARPPLTCKRSSWGRNNRAGMAPNPAALVSHQQCQAEDEATMLRKGAAAVSSGYSPPSLPTWCGVTWAHRRRQQGTPGAGSVTVNHDRVKIMGAASSSLTTPFPHQLAAPLRRGNAIRQGMPDGGGATQQIRIGWRFGCEALTVITNM